MYKISDLRLPIDFDKDNLDGIVSQILHTSKDNISNCKLYRLSIDARHKDDIRYVVSIVFDMGIRINLKKFKNISTYTEEICKIPRWTTENKNIVIVGSGPSGLFSALALIESGCKVTILERGYDMEKRKVAVENLMNNGILDTRSNIQFGEGGAGTFSDGKLNTGIKSGYISYILSTFVRFGANEDILYDNRPHIGTDILSKVIVNIRKYIERKGSRILFEHTLKSLNINNGKVDSIVVDTPSGEEIFNCDELILAIGHSSRDTIRKLYEQGVNLIQKSFSMGFRIEHKQSDINFAQYGEVAKDNILPPADYHLSIHLDNGRSVYTFCMCPGGVVVPAMSESNTIVTNGMSYNSRNGENANSALLVGINPSDFPTSNVLSGIDLQEKYERLAYKKNNSYKTTVQRVGDFLKGIPSKSIGDVIPSYKPGYVPGDVSDLMPDFVINSLKQGIQLLDSRLHGFASPDAILTAVETRSSAPYQAIRNPDLTSTYSNLYMVGEGAGFAGGIVSSAVDGIKSAIKIIEKYNNNIYKYTNCNILLTENCI